MDRGKQPAASPPPLQQQRTAYPASFEAYFSAMGLGGASSSGQEPQTPRQAQLQQRYATPNSPLMLPQPPPSQGGGGGGQGGVHPLMQQHQMMLAQMRATQLQQQQQQQTSSYCVGEQGSSTNGYFWPVGHGGVSPAEAAAHAQGSSDYAMLLAADRPMPLAADRILPSAADGSSSDYLSRFANGYANNAAAAAPAAPRPPVAPRPCTLRANASQYQPIGASSRSAVASPSPPRTRRHPYPHPANNYNPSAAIADYQERLVVMNALRANPKDPLWRGVSRISQGRTPEEIRSDMLRGPMPLQLVFFQESAAHVIRLLDEGAETGVDQYRLSALAAIKSDVHRVMEDREGCQVFMALVRASAEQEDEIHAIIAAAAAASAPPVDGNGKHKTTQLLRVTGQDYGEASLRSLILAAARYPDLCKLLTDCLVCERVMDHAKGDRLLHDCFRAMNYEDSKILIKFACYHANKMLLASSGSRCLVECFMNARGEELEHLEQLILANATMIAKGHYSNYFMQKVLEHGSEALKRELVALLMADVVSLSRQQFGSYVVEACFLKGSSDLKRIVISTFVSLTNDQLADVVQCGYGNYVIQKLVEACKDDYPEETILLARRIERLPGEVLDRMSAKQVMKVVRRLFPRHRIY
uniref:PUM-HD domain-containing protein n=1 Tax=Oryza rufipogon TaxID=4529 RepID=A0A0E0NQW8_ORYRU